MPSLRPELQAIVKSLVLRGERQLGLNVIADAIGVLAVSPDDIDALFASLEQHGCIVGEPELPAASACLARVLVAARQLKATLGRTPSTDELCRSSNLTPEIVRLALLFARVLQR